MGRVPLGLLNDAEHWRDRGEEARTHAGHLTNPEAKRMMRAIAESYDNLAQRAVERRLNDGSSESRSRRQFASGRGWRIKPTLKSSILQSV
jgi:hypothetical protein